MESCASYTSGKGVESSFYSPWRPPSSNSLITSFPPEPPLIPATIAFVVITHLVIPVGLIAALWWPRPLGRLEWGAAALLATVYTAFIVLVGFWGWLGIGARVVLVPVLAAALIRSAHAAPPRPAGLRRSWLRVLGIAFRFSAAGIVLVGLMEAARGHIAPPGAIDMLFPLRAGVHLVGHGGSTAIVNYHRPYPAQSYALDIVGVNRAGTRARGIYPSDLERYAIFDDVVHAPCTGIAVLARDGLPDNVPPARDAVNLAGNVVAIECGTVVVVLAHLREGTVGVREGMPVQAGEPVGRVGNSGNTTEPHLHVHAEEGPFDGSLLVRPGVPLRFGGRFLVRNSIVRGSRISP